MTVSYRLSGFETRNNAFKDVCEGDVFAQIHLHVIQNDLHRLSKTRFVFMILLNKGLARDKTSHIVCVFFAIYEMEGCKDLFRTSVEVNLKM